MPSFSPALSHHRTIDSMSFSRSNGILRLHRTLQHVGSTSIYSSCRSPQINPHTGLQALVSRSYIGSGCSPTGQSFIGSGKRSIVTCSYTINATLSSNACVKVSLRSLEVSESRIHPSGKRFMSTAAKVPTGARKVGLKVTMTSPGIVYEPYALREPIPFWRRWFTLAGWRRTKEDLILEMKSAYAISRLRKVTGHSKKIFYQQAISLYKEINTLMARGDTSSLRKLVTEKMYSTLKNDLKRRESIWRSVYWELVEPVVSIRTLRARMIALDKDDLNKSFVQLTIEFTTKQKFEAYDSKGGVVSGDKEKKVLVRDIWVFEKSLFHPGSDWRLCSRITL